MAFRRPINLGQAQTTVGGATPLQAPPQQAKAIIPGQTMPQQGTGSRLYGVADALSNTPEVTGGSVVEALAAALTGGLRGRVARREHDAELKTDARAAERQDRAEQLAQVLAGQQQQDRRRAEEERNRVTDWAKRSGDPNNMVDPAGAFQANRLANAPLTPDQRADNELGSARLEEERRHNRVSESNSGSGGGFGRPPAGYRYTQEGNLEPIPGGPAASRVDAQANRATGAILSQMQNNQLVTAAIRRARNYANSFGTTGVIGHALEGVPTTNAHGLQNELQTIRANIGFDKLAEMRANSPTGGALGNVSDRETALLQSVMGSLQQSQTREQFLEHLGELERTYAGSMQRLRRAYDEDVRRFGAENVPAPPAGGDRVYNPATGRLE